MSLRHVATLALLGCYPISPPTSPGQIHDDLPLSQWSKLGTFETDSDCKTELANLYNLKIDEAMRSDRKVGPEGYKGFHRIMTDLQCIRTDDPRLKS